MLEKIIEGSVRNRFLVLLVTAFLAGWGVYSLINTPVDAIPDLSDVQVIVYTEYPGQSPRIVEDQVTYPLTTAMVSVPGVQGGARLLVLRVLARLRHLRGRDRHLLGAEPRPRVPELRAEAAAVRDRARARPRRDRRRLGLRVHRHVRPALARGAALAPGLVSPVRPRVGPRRRRGREHRRVREAVPGDGRPRRSSSPTASRSHDGRDGDPPLQQRRRRRGHRARREGVHGPRASATSRSSTT